ncbi:MAG: thioredoxin [bacterium]
MSVIHIKNVEEFTKEVMQSGKLAVIDFRAERCGPCRMLGPIIEQLGEEHKDVVIAKVNVDENQELSATFQVSSIPVVFFVKDGKVIDKVVGANPPTVYKEKIAEHSQPTKVE